MKAAIGVVLIMIAFMMPVSARDAEGGFTTRGSGVDSCGKWTSEHNNDTALARVQNAWLMGYLSAYNYLTPNGAKDVVAGTDAAGLYAAVTQYCSANPLNDITDAAIALVRQLNARRSAK